MGSDLYVALSGALSRLRELEVVANNLANANTVGFKRDRSTFVAALEGALTRANGEPTPGVSPKVFAAPDTGRADLRSGPVQGTGAPLDVALQGPGFFEVETPEGPRYTRAGSFSVNEAGQLATPDGHPVLGAGGPISLAGGAAEISDTGAVLRAPDELDAPPEELGRLKVVEFEDPDVLVKEGQLLFRAPDEVVPNPLADPRFASRSLESSNVQPVQELADLVFLQRSFDVAMQMLETDDDLTRRLIQEVSS